MLDRSEAGAWRYLTEDFRVFHLRDSLAQKLPYHYHEFDKLVLMRQGKVTYVVEGVRYDLQPWDLLLIQRGMVHLPVIDPSEPYERTVLWLSPLWLRKRQGPDPLDRCFHLARERGFHLTRIPPERRTVYAGLLQRLREPRDPQLFGSAQMLDTLCQQLLILVNRDFLAEGPGTDLPCRRDPKIDQVLQYIAVHLAEPLTNEDLARRFYLSRSHLMHRFKEVTGCTVHQYVSQRRLIAAGELIRAGCPVMSAAEQAGFTDYSTFLRAFQRTFGVRPREFQRRSGAGEAEEPRS